MIRQEIRLRLLSGAETPFVWPKTIRTLVILDSRVLRRPFQA